MTWVDDGYGGQMNTDWPEVEVRPVRRGKIWDLEVICPHCGSRHYHGGTNKPPETIPLGARVAHCARGEGGSYRLVRGPMWAMSSRAKHPGRR